MKAEKKKKVPCGFDQNYQKRKFSLSVVRKPLFFFMLGTKWRHTHKQVKKKKGSIITKENAVKLPLLDLSTY